MILRIIYKIFSRKKVLEKAAKLVAATSTMIWGGGGGDGGLQGKAG